MSDWILLILYLVAACGFVFLVLPVMRPRRHRWHEVSSADVIHSFRKNRPSPPLRKP